MGTFACYNGSMCISEENKILFKKQMLKILNYGGMLQFENVNLYGKEISLIKSPESDENGRVEFHYNYFEDDAWESAIFKVDDLYLGSGKIGEDEFNWAIRAAYSLYEAYDDGVGTVEQDGQAVNSGECLGWINYVLGTNFTIKNRYRLWEYFETKGLQDYEEGEECTLKMLDIINIVPSRFFKGLGGVELADICNILEGTSTLEEETLLKDSYPEAVLKVKKELKKYYGVDENNENRYKRLAKMLKLDKEKRSNIEDVELLEIAKLSLHMPARVFVYISAEILKKNFWELWKKLARMVYQDEDCSSYATKEIYSKRDEIRNTIMPNVTTEEYFYNDGYFSFFKASEEVKKLPPYYISKDECAYWWKGEDEYFSKSMLEWMQQLALRHKEIVEGLDLLGSKKEDFLKMMIDVLYEVNHRYKRIFAYRDMFYEFLLHADNKDFYAALILLKELSDENKSEAKIIENIEGRWSYVSRKVTFNIGRRRMKRYLAVMANVKLREKYFGF